MAGCKPRVRVSQWPGSVFGARCSALGVNPGPGPGSQVPGTRDLEPGIRRLFSKNSHTGYARCRMGLCPRFYPGNTAIGQYGTTALLRYGCRIQDAYPVCAFSGGRARSSVLGVRSSASIRLRCRVPGPRCQIAGTRYLVPVLEKPAHGVCMMQDAGWDCVLASIPAIRQYGNRTVRHYCSVKIWMQDTGCMMQDKNGSDSAYPVAGTWYLAPFPHLKS
jgi:hypothetical protein